MTNKNGRAESTYTVLPLDEETLCSEAMQTMREGIASGKSERKNEPARCWSRGWAITRTPIGIYAICEEGVGPSKTLEEGSLDIEFWFESKPQKTDTGERRTMSIFPELTLSLDSEDAVEYVDITRDPVPLHEWIRTFGSRLEHNYYHWQETLERAHDNDF